MVEPEADPMMPRPVQRQMSAGTAPGFKHQLEPRVRSILLSLAPHSQILIEARLETSIFSGGAFIFVEGGTDERAAPDREQASPRFKQSRFAEGHESPKCTRRRLRTGDFADWRTSPCLLACWRSVLTRLAMQDVGGLKG